MLDLTGIIKGILNFFIKNFKSFKVESQIAQEIENKVNEVFERHQYKYTYLEDIAEDGRLNNYLQYYSQSLNKETAISAYIEENNLTGEKAIAIKDFLTDLSDAVLTIYTEKLSHGEKVLLNSMRECLEDIVTKNKYDIQKIVLKLESYISNARFDLLEDAFDFLNFIELANKDRNLITYLKNVIFQHQDTSTEIQTDNISILKFIVRLNLWCGYSDFSNVVNIQLLSKDTLTLINKVSNNQLNDYIVYKKEEKSDARTDCKRLICETVLFEKFRKLELPFCKRFYELNMLEYKNDLTNLIYDISNANDIRFNFEINPTESNKNFLTDYLMNIQNKILDITKLNIDFSKQFIIAFIRLINFNVEKLNKFRKSLSKDIFTDPLISYTLSLANSNLQDEKPLVIITQCILNKNTLLLKKYLMKKYKKPCAAIITFFEKYNIFDNSDLYDADLFSIYAEAVILSNRITKSKKLYKIRKLKKFYGGTINYSIVLGLYYYKFDKNKLKEIDKIILTKLKDLISGLGFSDLVNYIAKTKNDKLLNELLSLEPSTNFKLQIAELLYRNDARYFCNEIITLLDNITDLNVNFTKIKADCLYMSDEKVLSLKEYKKILERQPTDKLYSIVLATSIELNQDIEDCYLSKMQKIKDFEVQYNLGLYFKIHQQHERAKKHILQSLLLNDKDDKLKGGMFSILLDDKNAGTFICDYVKANIVVYLTGENEKILFIHDNDVEFTETSTSYGAEHLVLKDIKLNDLRLKTIGDNCIFNGIQYKIKKLMPMEKVIFNDCMKSLEKVNAIQTFAFEGIESFKDTIKSQIKSSTDAISQVIKKYNTIENNKIKPSLSFLSNHIGKIGLDGYTIVLSNPSIYKLNSVNHFNEEKECICNYDIICMLAILELTEIDFSLWKISETTKNRLINEAHAKLAELENAKTKGEMYIYNDNLFMYNQSRDDIKAQYVYYSNIINILTKIKTVGTSNVFSEDNKDLKKTLHNFYSDFEFETIACAREHKLTVLTDDSSISAISSYYKLDTVGILEIIINNISSKIDIVKYLIKLKEMSYYNFVDSKIINELGKDQDITVELCNKLVDVSTKPEDFETAIIGNYKFYLKQDFEKFRFNKVLSAMYRYIEKDFEKKYEILPFFNTETSELSMRIVPRQ